MDKVALGLRESNLKTLWENEWIEIREIDGFYTYMHQKKCDGKAVAVLGFSKDGKVLGRFERVPCHGDGITLCSLTGMVDPGEEFLDAAVRELEEESGISMPPESLISLGEVRPSKASDTVISLWAVEVEYQPGEFTGEGDGTEGEKGAYCKFVTMKEAARCKDPLVPCMILRYISK